MTPSDLSFHQYYPERFLLYDKVDPTKKLYLTTDGGKTFELIQEFVKSFYWLWNYNDKDGQLYYERIEPSGTSQLLKAASPSIDALKTSLLKDIQDFQVKGDYMFATRALKEGGAELLISSNGDNFLPARFETDLPLLKYQVADVTPAWVMVAAMHSANLTCLYVSRVDAWLDEYRFALSLHAVMAYFPYATWRDSWLESVAEEAFTDVYRVEGVPGVYIASRVTAPAHGALGTEHLASLITFDHGVTWRPLQPPTHDENGVPINCRLENSCSLHLSQKFSQLYPITRFNSSMPLEPEPRSASIMSSKSAPGIIMATGVLGKSMKGIPGVYVSRDAGVTWRRILKDPYFFNAGDHGGVLVAVKYFKSRGETRRILYSTDEGKTWSSYQFHAEDLRVYGLMTEPGENTTTFTMFGSANDHHQWIIITVDLRNAFARNCTPDDYKPWSPAAPNSSLFCILGARKTYQRRLAHTNCYNGIDYDRPVKIQKCECSRIDYECDTGFVVSGSECIRNKSSKIDPYAIPEQCPEGAHYQRTKGYRKIAGDSCVSDYYVPYEPAFIPCPMGETAEFLVVSMRDRIARVDLETNKTSFYPIKDVKNIVAIEFDLKNNCIYFADTEKDKIGRQCLSDGKNSVEIIVENDLASIEGMALDWISNVLFFVDGMRNKIEAVRTDISTSGRMRRTILGPATLKRPRGIAVHPKAGYLFWTDWNSESPMIARTNLDGTNMKKLFGKPIVEWPNGITIDQISGRIYWVDAKIAYIGSSDLNGQYFKKVIMNNPKVAHPFAVAVLKDRMYWNDWKAGAVFSADKDTGADIVTLPTATNTLSLYMDLKVFAHAMEHGGNACSLRNTSCSAMCLGGPRGTFSCLCPDGLAGKDGQCLCASGVKPYPNMTCPVKGNTCAPKEWRCANGLCISETWRCDGDNDCGDGSDEQDCPPRCLPPRVSCDNGQRCLPPHWTCDAELDCLDKSDEMDCHKHNCSSTEMSCGSGECVNARWRCDGENDCKDGSDELDCPAVKWSGECAETEFRCPGSLRCIPQEWRCDGEMDCAGGADESAALCANTTCSDTMFRCVGNGRCIFKAWVCDGENDCMDGGEGPDSDERNCSLATPPPPRPSHEPPPHQSPTNICLNWMFMCKNGNCLPAWWRCDQINDCGDGSDELGCDYDAPDWHDTTTLAPSVQEKATCDSSHFTCARGICIPLEWVCDGSPDCPDEEDERDCSSPRPGHAPRPAPCASDETPCADGARCILTTQICDGKQQCSDGSDEANCPNGTHSGERECARDWWQCDGGARCVPPTARCDSRQDCLDNSDESDCTAPSPYKNAAVGVDQRSITSTGFLVSCWVPQQRGVVYSLLPSISKVGAGVWRNMTSTTENIYRFTDLEPYTQYNVTFYIRDSATNRTVASGAYVNVTTAEGEPTPPRRVMATQQTGRCVLVQWDAPARPNGRVVRYSVSYSPPYPPIEFYTQNTSIEVYGNFQPATNYTFWVRAHNSVHTSTAAAATLEFDSMGDVDSLSNASVSPVNGTCVRVRWDRVRGADGYELRVALPQSFAGRAPVSTRYTNYTVCDLPPGVSYHVSVSAFKGTTYGRPFTIPLHMSGQNEERLELKSILLTEEGNAVRIEWRRPSAPAYQNKTLIYHVYYTHTYPTSRANLFTDPPQVVTSNTSVVLRGLLHCESYLLTASVRNGPLANPMHIRTRYNVTEMSVRSLRAQIVSRDDSLSLEVDWLSGCAVMEEPTVYTLEVQDLNRALGYPWLSRYRLQSSDNASLHYSIPHVSRHARFNVCVAVEGSVRSRCVVTARETPPPPRNLAAFLSPDGHLVVNFHAPDSDKYTYEVLISDVELARNATRTPPPRAAAFNTSASPFHTRLEPPAPRLYVGVRLCTEDGYLSDLNVVRVLHIDARADAAARSWSGWPAGVAGGAAALAAAAALLHLLLRRRQSAHGAVSRYDSRRGQAVIHRHEDDDAPQFHGFSDDEPLVIA